MEQLDSTIHKFQLELQETQKLANINRLEVLSSYTFCFAVETERFLCFGNKDQN